MMTKDNRRYYLDLKENARGRFLRVSGRTVNVRRLQDRQGKKANETEKSKKCDTKKKI